jgi:hypothetical protein
MDRACNKLGTFDVLKSGRKPWEEEVACNF